MRTIAQRSILVLTPCPSRNEMRTTSGIKLGLRRIGAGGTSGMAANLLDKCL
jgi:hypothetical protein